MTNTIFSFIPILFLIWLMVKKNSLPSKKALPLSALVLYFISLIIFKQDPNLVHANILKGLLVAWTPILIIGGAIFLFKTMEETGSLKTVTDWLNTITENKVAQLMIVGWAFPFLIEGASGFGTPAAIAAPVLVGLGFKPIKVAILALIMNTVPVSFGAVGTPTWFGFSAINLTNTETLSIAVKSATIHSIIALFIVIIAILQLVNLKKILENAVFVVLSVAFTVVPYLLVSFLNYEFPSLIGGSIGLIVSIILAEKNIGLKTNSDRKEGQNNNSPITIKQLIKATFPLWGTILLLIITRIPELGIKHLLTSVSPVARFSLGMLGDFSISSSLVVQIENIFQTSINWSHKILYVPSLLPFALISLITFRMYKTSRKDIRTVMNSTITKMINPTYALLGSLVFVNLMMMGGEMSAVNNIGNILANATGKYWMFFASYLGAIGSFFSGSATISNLTFAGIQDSIALQTNIDRTTILALQSVGGAFGNMVCINNIVAVTSVLSISNKDGYILKKTVLPMLFYGALAGSIALVLF